MTQRKSNPGVIAGLALIFVLLLAANFLTPMTADDFLFSFSHAHWSRLTGVDEILPSMAALRQNTNGRVLAHFFVQLFLLWPRPVFNVLNAAMGTLLFYILYRYVRRGERTRDLLLLLLLFSLLFLLLPAFGQVFLWLTGACNYAWTAVVTFAFLYPFFSEYMGQGREAPLLVRLLHLPLAFAAGAWSENGSLAVLCAAFAFLGMSWLREKKPPRTLMLRFLVACGGFLFLMSAPSEWSGRRGEVSESTLTKALARLSGHFSPIALLLAGLAALLAAAVLIWLLIRKRQLGCRLCRGALALVLLAGLFLFWRRDSAAAAFISDTLMLLFAALCLWAYLMLLGLEKGLDTRTMLSALIFALAGLASVLIFLVALYFPARSACPFICCTTLADALLLAALWDRGSRKPLWSTALAACALTLLLLPMAAEDIVSVHRQSRERDALLREASETPHAQAVVEPIVTRSKYPATWPGDESYFSYDIALYYGLDGFQVTEYVNEGE